MLLVKDSLSPGIVLRTHENMSNTLIYLKRTAVLRKRFFFVCLFTQECQRNNKVKRMSVAHHQEHTWPLQVTRDLPDVYKNENVY